MAYWNQRTVAARVSCTGIGLHSGKPATLTLAPAGPDAGITFVRMDLGVEIAARSEHVTDTTLSTSIGIGAARVATVEHVMAALSGMGIDNCRVEVDGPEIPILDGSAAPFVCLVQQVGVKVQRAGKRYLVIDEPVELRDGDKVARLDPAEAFSVEFTADFGHPLITNQSFRVVVSDRSFDREVARARTFCFRRDIERMQAMGLGLRFPDEFARHKVLDAIGDLALLGMPVVGALSAVKSGHAMNQALVRKVLADPSSHRVVRVTAEADAPALRAKVAALAIREGQVA